MNTTLHKYEEFYKLGFDHVIYKKVLGLKKPNTRSRIFYMGLILTLIAVGATF